jgi:predicted GNAT superfamily acetyltransferase
MRIVPKYTIQSLHTIESFSQCLEIQKQAWGFKDQDVLPLRMFVVCTKIGGHVFGAVDEHGKVLGFLNALPGIRDGQVFLHSHMMGVLPDYQNLGIGRNLKLAQRQEALGRNIQHIEWTFDPLEIRNARFNIELLGTICRRYLVNTYGVTTSHLHGGLPTDRLVAEWHLDSTRVSSALSLASHQCGIPTNSISVDLPLSVGELKTKNPTAGLATLLKFRETMLDLLAKNYCVTRFEIDQNQQKAFYHLEIFNEDTLNW